jgi:hypothetical protein
VTAPSRGVLIAFAVASALELVSITVLLVNLATAHSDPVTSIMGPVHGGFYLIVVAIAVLARGLRPRTRLLSIIPVLGGGYVLWFVPAALGRTGSDTLVR